MSVPLTTTLTTRKVGKIFLRSLFAFDLLSHQNYKNDLNKKKSWENIFRVAFCLFFLVRIAVTTTLTTRKVEKNFEVPFCLWVNCPDIFRLAFCLWIDWVCTAIRATLTTRKDGIIFFKVAFLLGIDWTYYFTATVTTRKIGIMCVTLVVLITPNFGGN